MIERLNLQENAMLYKDITQWLRNRSFALLFLGLVSVGWLVPLCVGLLPLDDGVAGPVSYGWLSFFLFLYTIVISLMGYSLTAKEFSNRTFELYELSGMSLERMVRGKFVSLLVQFCFGFFCIVPFMFVSYILGGLDFYTVLGYVLVTVCFAPPLFLLAVAGAFFSKYKHGQAVMRLVTILGGLFLVTSILPLSLRVMMGFGGGISGPEQFLKNLIEWDGDTWLGLAVFSLFYGLGMAILFYVACNAISPPTDSRQGSVQGLATLFWFCAVLLIVELFLADSNSFLASVTAVLLHAAGLVFAISFVINRLHAPVMPRKREENMPRGLRRLALWCFRSNAWGGLRTLSLFYLFSLLPVLLHQFGILRFEPESLLFCSLPLQIPFFLALPLLLLLPLRHLRQQVALSRNLTIGWWLTVGVFGLMLYLGTEMVESLSNRPQVWAELLAFGISPLSSLFTGVDNDSVLHTLGPVYRAVLGAVGLFLLARILQFRQRRFESDRSARIRVEKSAGPDQAEANAD